MTAARRLHTTRALSESERAQAVACCPHCQVPPGTPCHTDGVAIDTVHARRLLEAKEMTA